MRVLIQQLRVRLRNWLLKEEIAAIDCMLVQSALVVGTGENLLRQNGLVLAELERFKQVMVTLAGDELSRHRALLSAIDSVHLRSEKALTEIAETKAGVDRLVELVTPKAERLQGRRPVVGGWDQVLTENLKQFEEAEKR